MRKPVFFVSALLVLITLACGFNFSTANIAEATLAKDPDGEQPTTTFDQDETFYLVAEVVNAPDDTSVKAVWTAVEADAVEPDFSLGEKEVTGGGAVNFSLENDQLWPIGQYRVDLYLNGELDRTLEFEVAGDVVAGQPTDTPVPTPTPSPEPTIPPRSAAGDSLSLEPVTEAPTEELIDEPGPLPFQEEPYVHPSGAFSLAVPESWNQVNEDEISAAFGDRLSRVGVIFVNFAEILDEAGMQEFIEESTQIIADSFTDNYEVAGEENTLTEDGFYYVALSFDEGDGAADLFFEQLDTVVYVLYFASFEYAELDPTWSAIIDSYEVDPEAAIAAAPASEPTATPQPQSQPPPGPSIPAGKGMLIFYNNTGSDFVVDVIGPTNTSEVVPPNSSQEFVLDPGHYTLNGHSPGGQWTINAYEFDLAADQAFPLNLN